MQSSYVRIHQTRIDVSQLFQRKEIRRGLGIFKLLESKEEEEMQRKVITLVCHESAQKGHALPLLLAIVGAADCEFWLSLSHMHTCVRT